LAIARTGYVSCSIQIPQEFGVAIKDKNIWIQGIRLMKSHDSRPPSFPKAYPLTYHCIAFSLLIA